MTLAPPSLPSLLASETQESIVEYLTTTFALSDPATQTALRDFLGDADTGIFRGPYLKIRTPYQPVGEGWVSPLALAVSASPIPLHPKVRKSPLCSLSCPCRDVSPFGTDIWRPTGVGQHSVNSFTPLSPRPHPTGPGWAIGAT